MKGSIKMKKEQKLTSQIALALTVGLLSLNPAGYAMPQGGTSDTAKIATSSTQMDITSEKTNNVVNWTSFSIAKGETVQFDKGAQTNNYLNIVKGTSMSEIYGTMKGGNNVYLINPNGILFGAGAQVNVGHLIASTRTLNDANLADFAEGKNPITNSTATEATGDIVNMGRLQCASLVMEGQDVRIINTADITRNGTTILQGADVTIKADSLEELVTLKTIANALQHRVSSNYRFVLSFNSALIALGALGILQPAASAMLHNLSTIGISLRSMTNLIQKPSSAPQLEG